MVERYFKFKEDGVFSKLLEDVPDMELFMLSMTEEKKLKEIRPTLQNLQQVTLKLQDQTITFREMRVLFDYVMQEYPTMNLYISQDAQIIHSPDFESALVKISQHQEQTLNENERASVEKLKRLNIVIEEDKENAQTREVSFIEKAFIHNYSQYFLHYQRSSNSIF